MNDTDVKVFFAMGAAVYIASKTLLAGEGGGVDDGKDE